MSGTRQEDPITERCARELIEPSPETWQQVREAFLQIEKAHFGEGGLSEEEFAESFNDPDSIIVLTRDVEGEKIVGFTFTQPVEHVYGGEFHPERPKFPKTAYVVNTGLDPNYVGHKLIGPMMDVLEKELVRRGYEFIERDAATANNYAGNIKKAYGESILESQEHQSQYGDQVFFRIKLLESTK